MNAASLEAEARVARAKVGLLYAHRHGHPHNREYVHFLVRIIRLTHPRKHL